MRENCLKEFDTHSDCLEKNNHVCSQRLPPQRVCSLTRRQEYYACRKPERTLNKCMFDRLVRQLRRLLNAALTFRQGLTKTIPGAPEYKTPIHLVEKPVFGAIQK